MIPYLLLLFIPCVFTFVAVDRSRRPHRLRIGSPKNELICKANLAIPLFFVLFFLLLALRHESIGRDLISYKNHFQVYSMQSLVTFDALRFESIYRLLNWIVGQFTDNYQVFLTIVAALTVFPMALVYVEERRHSYMQIIIFVSLSSFVICFSALRQAIAIALGMLAYRFVRKKQLCWFLLVSVLALGFHHSAFMIFLMYPIYYLRIKKNHLWIVVPILVVVFVFNRQIFRWMTMLLMFFGEEYGMAENITGAYSMLILFAAVAVFSYVVADESKMDDEVFGLRNFLLLTVVLQCFAPVHPLAMRMNYYYIVFIPIAIAKLVELPKPNMVRIAKLAPIVIVLYFTYDFVSKLYQSFATGISALDTIPYRFFWMN